MIGIGAFHRCLLPLGSLALLATVTGAGAREPPDDFSIAVRQAWAVFDRGDYATADALGVELLERAERDHGLFSNQVADALDLIVRSRFRGGRRNEPQTLELAERVVELREDLEGARDGPGFATSLHWLGVLHNTLWNLQLAETLQLEALAVRERLLPPDHRDIVQSLYQLGELMWDIGSPTRAREYLDRAVLIATTAIPQEDFVHSESLSRRAKFIAQLGEYARARDEYTRALNIRLDVYGPDHPHTATVQHNLGVMNEVLGDFAAARRLYEAAWSTRRARLGTHPHEASSVDAVARLAEWHGDYTAARAHYEQALSIYAATRGQRERQAELQHRLAGLEARTGDVDRALMHHLAALDVRRALYPSAHPELAMSLYHVGWARFSQGRIADAHDKLVEALSMLVEIRDPDHPDLGLVRLALATVKRAMGDRGAALELAGLALTSYEKAYGVENVRLTDVLILLGHLFFEQGEFGRATESFERARLIVDRTFGPDHPRQIEILLAQSRVLDGSGKSKLALARALDASTVARQELELTFRAFPERQALSYAATRWQPLSLSLAQLARLPDVPPSDVRRAWDELVRSRALVLNELAFRHRLALSRSDPEVTHLMQTLADARAVLGNLKVRGPGPADPDAYAAAVERSSVIVDGMERRLAERSLEFRRGSDRSAIGLDSVLRNLPTDAALVSYARYGIAPGPRNVERGSSEIGYLALVIAPGENLPIHIDLGSAAEIDERAEAWRREVSGAPGRPDALAAYRAAGRELRRRIWDPLAPRIAEARRVYIVPEGKLLLVNFAALPTDGDDFLVESEPVIHLLSTERDLVPVDPAPSVGQGLLALGGPDFNERSLFADLQPTRIVVGSMAANPVTSSMTRRAVCSDFSDRVFGPLPNTDAEVRTIVGIWEQGLGASEPLLLLNGARASEHRFKISAPGRRVLHIATHGFFLQGQCSTITADGSRGIGGLSPVRRERQTGATEPENPLLLSGLVLAGANHRDHAGPGEEDGILTSEEISSLDLGSVEWAVLSACETGLGQVWIGEGVRGLRRAFRVAGTRTVIMSLWSVADEPARAWMTALYTRRVEDRMTTADAVRRATLDVLERRRREGEPIHPFFWAAFVAAGDPS